MPDSNSTVLSLGEILIDLIASDGATELARVASFDVRPGGAPANAAVALARLGVPAAFCGVVGGDPFGQRLLETLGDETVDISRVRSVAGRDTTLAFAWKDHRGDGHFRILRMADALLEPEDVERAGIDKMAAIVVGSVSLSAEPSRSAIVRAVEIAHASRVPVCFDANVRPALWSDPQTTIEACRPVLERSALIKLSLDDALALLPGAIDPAVIIRDLSITSAQFVVVTDGPRGAWFGARNGRDLVPGDHIPAFSVDAIDPTGAGDAFTAAIISRLIANGWRSLSAADVRYAAAAGAITTTRRGAMSSLPTASEIDAFLARHHSYAS